MVKKLIEPVIRPVRELHQKHQRWVPIVFFLAGFIFDAIVLKRIDELEVILQQAVYLVLAAVLIGVELIELHREVHAPRWLAKVWKHREAFLHFLLGTLLNCYTIFYFKSASAMTSFGFIACLVGLLMVNEFKRFGESQTKVHMAFWSLCLISYSIALAPILIGSLGVLSLLGSIFGVGVGFWAFYRVMAPKLADTPSLLRTHVIVPFGAVFAFFALLYCANMIPPVPLSVQYMGIYHDIQKTPAGEYSLFYTRPWWKFWQHGDQTFYARPGDTIFCFAQVFSPARFKDQLQVRWKYYDVKRGWQSWDAIPMSIVGGREEGYRGITKKANYTPGEWRVQIETLDGREIGGVGFVVERDDSTDLRVMSQTVR